MLKIIPLLAVCFWLTSVGCAAARTGAVFDSGVKAYDAGDYAKAYALWISIEDEDIAAMRNVAILLRKGLGVAKNPKKAEEMYERAAEAGLVTAQADLADMLLHGEAGQPDPKRALPLLEAAAAGNHPRAQYELGQMYETGGLVPQNVDVARRLYLAAARHGMKEAASRLAALGSAAPEMASVSTPPLSTTPTSQASVEVEPAAAASGSDKTRSEVYAVQIGAYKSQVDADAGWRAYQAKYTALLLGYSRDVQYTDLGNKGTWYRLRIVGAGNHEVALNLCDRLKADGADCVLRKER